MDTWNTLVLSTSLAVAVLACDNKTDGPDETQRLGEYQQLVLESCACADGDCLDQLVARHSELREAIHGNEQPIRDKLKALDNKWRACVKRIHRADAERWAIQEEEAQAAERNRNIDALFDEQDSAQRALAEARTEAERELAMARIQAIKIKLEVLRTGKPPAPGRQRDSPGRKITEECENSVLGC